MEVDDSNSSIRPKVELDGNFHIKAIEFPTNEKNNFQLLNNMQKILNMPTFAIISGANGSGKSILLKYIEHNIREISKSNRKFIRIDSSFGNTGEGYNNLAIDLTHQKGYIRDIVIEQLKNPDKIINKSSNNVDRIASDISKDLLDNPTIERTQIKIEELIDKSKWLNSETDIRSYLENAMTIFKNIVQQYKYRKNSVRTSTTYLLDLYNYINNKNGNDNIDQNQYREFLGRFNQNREQVQNGNLIDEDKFIETMIDDLPPLRKINELLERYEFPYGLIEDKEDLILDWKGSKMSISNLSSGEYMLLTFISWCFYLDYMKDEDDRLKILMLDEADKHLDPILCKRFFSIIYNELHVRLGIQVIFATHRLDTIVLAPADCFYALKKRRKVEDGQAMIEAIKCHKFKVFSRIACSIKELLNLYVRVNVESENDAKFYTSIYEKLKKNRANIRSGIRNKSIETSFGVQNVPSKRYEFIFYPMNGRPNVNQFTNIDRKAHEIVDSHNQQFEVKLPIKLESLKPMGFIDQDYIKLEKCEGILPIERYALENFLYDPFLFNSVENDFNSDRIKLKDIPNYNNIGEHFNQTCKYFYDIQQNIDMNNFQMQIMQDNLEAYFDVILTIMKEKFDDICLYRDNNPDYKKSSGQKIRDKKTKDILNQIGDIKQNKRKLCCFNVHILINYTSTLTLKYSCHFLRIRGHDITECVFGDLNFENKLIETISHAKDNMKFIPMDLVESIFTIYERIRTNFKMAINDTVDSDSEDDF